MKFATSYFNAAVFKKNTARYWPIWGTYLFIWIVVLILPQMISYSRYAGVNYPIQQVLAGMQAAGIIGGFIFALLSAMAIWSYLYSPRSASFMASLPIKREGMFLTNYLTGLIWYVGANVIIAAVLAVSTFAIGHPDMIGVWTLFKIVTLSGFFFYSFATLLAQLTGNILMLPLIYGILNFAWILLEVIVSEVMRFFLYGYTSSGPKLTALSPIVKMFGMRRYDTPYVASYEWTWLYIYAAVGLVLAAIALLLYRRRAMESAGDVVAVRALRPVFKYFTTFAGAIVFGSALFMVLDGGGSGNSTVLFIIIMVVMSFICCYIAEALLHKSFRVIRRGLAGFAISAVVMVAAVVALDADLFGIERRVPDAEDVECVVLTSGGHGGELRAPENIRLVIEEHRDFVENRDNYSADWGGGWDNFRVHYVLKNGSTFERSYNLPMGSPAYQDKIESVKRITRSVEYRKRTLIAPFEAESNSMNDFSVSYYDSELDTIVDRRFEPEEAAEFYNDFYLRDVENGAVEAYVGAWDKSECLDARIYLYLMKEDKEEGFKAFYINFYLTPEATHIIEWFEEHGITLVNDPYVEM